VKRLIIISGVSVTLVLAGATVWHLAPISDRFYSDGETIHIPEAQAPLREILWQPPRPLPGAINLPDSDVYEPRLSADGGTIYFVRGRAGPNADIYYARRTNDGWTKPQPLDAINSDYADLGPEPASDDQALYFYSDRPGGLGGYDLWVAHRRPDGRTESDWFDPVNLGPGVNSVFNDYGPAVTPDGTTLYFSSNRPQPGDPHQTNPDAWSATLREDLFHRTYDLYVAAIRDGGSFQATPIGALNTTYNEGTPAVSAFGDFLYFSSDRSGGQGGFDLYRSRRLHGGHQVADNLGRTVNTPSNELDPGLSLGGYRLFFSSDRDVKGSDSKGGTHYGLFYTTSREVFRDVNMRHRAPINWAAWWSSLGPGLVWLIPAVLALLALLWLMRGLRERELKLLTRCLLASLFVHLLLLLLFSLWQVTASLAGEFRRGGRIQVALAAPSTAHDIALQVLGSLTDVTQPTAVPFESTRSETRLTLDTHAQPANISVERSRLDTIETPQVAAHVLDAAPTTVLQLQPRQLQPATIERSIVKADELATPDKQSRVRDTERPIDIPLPAPTPPVQHADISRADTFVAVETSPVEIPLARSAPPDAAALHDTSLAFSAPARDATPLTPSPPPLPTIHPLPRPPLGAWPISDTHLSDDVAARAAPRDEPEARVEPVSFQAAQAPLFDRPVDMPSHATIVHLQPAADSALTEEEKVFVSDWRPSDVQHITMTLERSPPNQVIENEPAFEPVTQLALPDNGTHPMAAKSAVVEPTLNDGLWPASVSSPTEPHAHPFILPPTDRLDRIDDVAPEPLRLSETDEPSPWNPDTIADAPSLPVDIASPVARRPLVATPPPPARFALKLDVPAEQAAPASPYAQRTAPNRLKLVERKGGSVATEQAVERALAWLARHQHPDGHWDAASFDVDCGQCGGETEVAADVALTGLSTLCFLGAGHTHKTGGPYRDTVARSLRWLVARQRPDGDLRADETMYTHGIATIALSEARAMTGDAALADPVERAVRFIYRSRNRDAGGWR